MKRLISILGTLIAGAAVGILFAPKSGKETREKIKELISEKMPNLSKERLEQLVDEVLKKVSSVDLGVEAEEEKEAEEGQEAEEEQEAK